MQKFVVTNGDLSHAHLDSKIILSYKGLQIASLNKEVFVDGQHVNHSIKYVSKVISR